LKTYRLLQSRILKKVIALLWMRRRDAQLVYDHQKLLSLLQNSSSTFLSGTSLSAASLSTSPLKTESNNRIWFHAASVGELESLWTVILASADQGAEIILTVLSKSAQGAVLSLLRTLNEKKTKVLFCGYAPWEGEWKAALQTLRPSLFVTAKYEAWPDLWISLKEIDTPLAIVAARARKSLRFAKWFCETLGSGLPDLLFFVCLPHEMAPLRELFPEAEIEVSGEPRWDRVMARSQTGNPRAKKLIQYFQSLPRPWGIIGSAWIQDLEFLSSFLKTSPGTLWVVPHKIDEKNLGGIETTLKNLDLKSIIRTSPLGLSFLHSQDSPDFLDFPGFPDFQGLESKSTAPRHCILVNEMGFLSELYTVADWVFVGGGFGAGVHSTIEPAIHGVPIGVGPMGTQKFSEIELLQTSGQLKILRTESDLKSWTISLQDWSPSLQSKWIQDSQSRLGSTDKILTAIENSKRTC
jgi:3-deoxy-D-manno-octulosonic-acid transferase